MHYNMQMENHTSPGLGPTTATPVAVKALIFDNAGRILLQKRDNRSDIWEPGLWGFFGGLVESGETPVAALIRELREELGTDVGALGPEVFRLDRGTYGILNIGFPVRYDEHCGPIRLGEGQAYEWFSVEQIVALPLSNLVLQHLSRILSLVAERDVGVVDRFENALLSQLNLRKKNDRVYYATRAPTAITRRDLILLRELATYRKLPFCRVCLHLTDQEPIHEMLMVHTGPLQVGPLKQNRNASLSYHMLDGTAEITLCDDDGSVFSTRTITSDDPSVPNSVRLDAGVFRVIRSISPYAIFLEVAGGPFVDNDTIWLTRNTI